MTPPKEPALSQPRPSLAQAAQPSAVTVGNYLDLLRVANLVYCLPPVGMGGKKVLRARNKYYLVDAALRNAVLLRGEEVLANPDDKGMVVETTVLRHLYAYHYRDTPQPAHILCYLLGQAERLLWEQP